MYITHQQHTSSRVLLYREHKEEFAVQKKQKRNKKDAVQKKQKGSSRCDLMTIQSMRLWCSVACLPRNPQVTSVKTSVYTEGSNARL